MKKKVIKLDKALSLDKETIANLDEDQLSTLEGGGTNTYSGPPPPAEANLFVTFESCPACSCNH